MITLDAALTALIYLAECFLLFLIGKFVYKLFQSKIKVGEELVEKDNLAFAVAHVGYFIGLLLAISSAVVGPSNGIWIDVMDIAIYGLLAIVLLNISIIINDKIILRKFVVYKEIIEDRNVGTGVIEGANAVATGLIILGSVSGEGGGIVTALVFWVVGQIILIITAYFYSWITPFDVHDHIEKDNVAVGLGFAGALVAIANLIRYGLMIDFVSWQESFINVGIDVLIGLIFLPIARTLTDKILLPGRSLTDELINQDKPNTGAGLIEAFAYIGGSVLITLCL
ncbi:uncharacterized membrane protein YjfL (UPF0719 family) [Catalinimonas alkaloidigena]|uniref:DUF350 domain-containing protein n=1 Tax=Catalinimonas alkaloidigena TaxID=1075417 RepID=UPI002406B8BF|nr:DUF350 domain-containing protein [Catalinimonas alkaloidigena]MDF9797673.1 uncharacterized membrane protein YjfL (UPF0719 family) [Catalinimonas alkaloidigena]